MDFKIRDYRKGHPKCRWCKYWKYNIPPIGVSCPDYTTCELKDKIIYGDWRAKFCKYYEVKED